MEEAIAVLGDAANKAGLSMEEAMGIIEKWREGPVF